MRWRNAASRHTMRSASEPDKDQRRRFEVPARETASSYRERQIEKQHQDYKVTSAL
jgi:hypothetical protein